MRENNRKSIASKRKLPQFITMNVIDGQASLVFYSSLIFYSLTIDNILNIIILLILARNINIKFNRKWTISKSTKVNNNIRNKRDRRSCKNIIYGKANR